MAGNYLSLGKSTVDIIAQFAPVPWLSPAVGLLCGIVELCENVETNRNGARQLRDRCHSLLLAIKGSVDTKAARTAKIRSALNDVSTTLADIQKRMADWADKSKLNQWMALFRQKEVAEEIQRCHVKISDCLSQFQIVAQLAAHEWQQEFQRNNNLDQAETAKWLEKISETNRKIYRGQQKIDDKLNVLQQLVQDLVANDVPAQMLQVPGPDPSGSGASTPAITPPPSPGHKDDRKLPSPTAKLSNEATATGKTTNKNKPDKNVKKDGSSPSEKKPDPKDKSYADKQTESKDKPTGKKPSVKSICAWCDKRITGASKGTEPAIFHENCFKCSACRKPITGEHVVGGHGVFHNECYECYDCGEMLPKSQSSFMWESHSGGQHKVFCPYDYWRGSRYHTCEGCGMLIMDWACVKPKEASHKNCQGCNPKVRKIVRKEGRAVYWHQDCDRIYKAWEAKIMVSGAKPIPAKKGSPEEEATWKLMCIEKKEQAHLVWTKVSAFEKSALSCIPGKAAKKDDAWKALRKFLLHIMVFFVIIDALPVSWRYPRHASEDADEVQETEVIVFKTLDLLQQFAQRGQKAADRSKIIDELSADLKKRFKLLIHYMLTAALKLGHERPKWQIVKTFTDRLDLDTVAGTKGRARLNIKGSFKDAHCLECGQSIQGQSVRLGTYRRWHPQCFYCVVCHKRPSFLPDAEDGSSRMPLRELPFFFKGKKIGEVGPAYIKRTPIMCSEHKPDDGKGVFFPVSQKETYGFVQDLALREHLREVNTFVQAASSAS